MWTIALSLAIGYGLGLAIVEVFDLFEDEEDTASSDPALNEPAPNLDLLDDADVEDDDTVVAPDDAEDMPDEEEAVEEPELGDDEEAEATDQEDQLSDGSTDEPSDDNTENNGDGNVIIGTDEGDVIGPASATSKVLSASASFAEEDRVEPMDQDTITNGEFDPETDVLVVDAIDKDPATLTAALIENSGTQTTDLVLSDGQSPDAIMTIYAIGLSWDNVSFDDWETPPARLEPSVLAT